MVRTPTHEWPKGRDAVKKREKKQLSLISKELNVAKLIEIQYEQHDFMKLSGIPWFSEATNQVGLAQGGIYLLSGPPGGGKTTLALQIACDLARKYKVLYIALEQSPSDIKQKIEKQIFPSRNNMKITRPEIYDSFGPLAKKMRQKEKIKSNEDCIGENLFIDSSVNSMEGLPDFLARKVLGAVAPYGGVSLIIVDSIQGLGTAPTSSKPYQKLFEFNRWAKENHITVISIGHVTKGGSIAGPKSLEHNVDCVLYLRKAMRLRPLFVPKNRFGAERHEPLILVMNEYGCLEKSKHVKARASHSYGFLGGVPGDIIEVQALVKLPKYGDKPGIKAPYLPKQKLSQLVGIIGSLHEIDISDLTFEINCALPGGRPYKETLDLPLTVSMLSSYFQREIPSGSLFIGELDLFANIRPLPDLYNAMLAETLEPREEQDLGQLIQTIYINSANVDNMYSAISKVRPNIDIQGVDNLESIVKCMWPDVMED